MTLAGGLVADGATLVDVAGGETLTGTALADALAPRVEFLTRLRPGLCLHRMGNTLDSVLTYLAALEAGRPIALIDPALDPAELTAYAETFQPIVITGLDAAAPIGENYLPGAGDTGGVAVARRPAGVEPDPELGILLATSGSTGRPKLVRLATSAVLANATAIAEALHIGAGDRAPTGLPLHYSYGLSVLNSHLAAGATVAVLDDGPLDAGFWTAVDDHALTFLAGVPFHYEQLTRFGWTPERNPSLRTLTQAGGRLGPDTVEAVARASAGAGARFHVMYGQTEATARMAVMPSEEVLARPGSVGPAIPGGRFTLADDEVVYTGPNVMLGYAERAEDLAAGDQLGGVLHTGDLGRLDDDGFLYLTGRNSRAAKIFGTRVNLDDVERRFAAVDDLAGTELVAVAGDDRVRVCVVGSTAGVEAARSAVAESLRINADGFSVEPVEAIPRLPSGKVDYRTLADA